MMSIITALRDRVVSDRNPAPRGPSARGRRLEKPTRDLRTFVHTHIYKVGLEDVSQVGFAVITDRGAFFDSALRLRPGMVRVVTTQKPHTAMAWYWDDFKVRNDLVARVMNRIYGHEPRLRGGWRRMTPTIVDHKR